MLALVEHAADEARDRISRVLPGGKVALPAGRVCRLAGRHSVGIKSYRLSGWLRVWPELRCCAGGALVTAGSRSGVQSAVGVSSWSSLTLSRGVGRHEGSSGLMLRSGGA